MVGWQGNWHAAGQHAVASVGWTGATSGPVVVGCASGPVGSAGVVRATSGPVGSASTLGCAGLACSVVGNWQGDWHAAGQPTGRSQVLATHAGAPHGGAAVSIFLSSTAAASKRLTAVSYRPALQAATMRPQAPSGHPNDQSAAPVEATTTYLLQGRYQTSHVFRRTG